MQVDKINFTESDIRKHKQQQQKKKKKKKKKKE